VCAGGQGLLPRGRHRAHAAVCVGHRRAHGRPARACTDTPKPWYSASGPPRRATLVMQSTMPWNSRSCPVRPRSAARRVRAKSSGYTISSEPAPASPPAPALPYPALGKCTFQGRGGCPPHGGRSATSGCGGRSSRRAVKPCLRHPPASSALAGSCRRRSAAAAGPPAPARTAHFSFRQIDRPRPDKSCQAMLSCTANPRGMPRLHAQVACPGRMPRLHAQVTAGHLPCHAYGLPFVQLGGDSGVRMACMRPAACPLYVRLQPRRPAEQRHTLPPRSRSLGGSYAERAARARSWGGRCSAPEARLMAKKRQKSVRGLALGNRRLMLSLNAKLKACVGKYLCACVQR